MKKFAALGLVAALAFAPVAALAQAATPDATATPAMDTGKTAAKIKHHHVKKAVVKHHVMHHAKKKMMAPATPAATETPKS